MAGGTKRLPRAVREQQMLDAAVKVFSSNGFYETSMDAVAREANISKPMLYLYYGSKDELFAACVSREAARFMQSMELDADASQPAAQLLRSVIAGFLKYVDAHRDAWRVMYREATGQAAFAEIAHANRERVVEVTAMLLREASKYAPEDTDFTLYAVALVGSGEAIADRLAAGYTELDRAVEIMYSFIWGGIRGDSRSV
ncbi:TetR/AcrR family transcriptional regulator [Tsukamurella sp. 8F]|uniref:TetR/AcrR family transcriptional regulator n=1 Tax=unclassified Tsukamurella TaxID=2633480 RepID=UPI0023B98F0D|nr:MULTISPECIES: TetR/AcrR family transcriptional regulator [unclassified Tsukamurella]MDF0529875.1 TetR/AcrR family transcriptional regulator [Tsukamurella sp. 8J]MDF0588670.1 TetR/AcrR family transcriptional regulator [Tsukamurella sp. 8F]